MDCGTLIVGSGSMGVPRGPLAAQTAICPGPRGRGFSHELEPIRRRPWLEHASSVRGGSLDLFGDSYEVGSR